MGSLLDKIRKNTVIDAQILKNSKYLDNGRRIKTRIPLLDLALSGSLKDGGLPPGILQIAAPPKHFKTKFLHEIMYAFQEDNKDKDYIIVLYDSELGSTPEYYNAAGINTEKVDHRVFESIEKLKSDISILLDNIERGDKILICIDSIGMARSNKEVQDAKDEKQAVDFTRAKEINSLFRIITAESAIKDVPIVVINHSYSTIEMYSKEVAAGGRKTQYAAHTLLFITKAQEKDESELKGFQFTLRAALSRYVRENSKFPITVTFDEGIYKYSGVFDLAIEMGLIIRENKVTYKVNMEGSKFHDQTGRRKSFEENDEFMTELLANEVFNEKIEKMYKL